jgi:hypothetical protein
MSSFEATTINGVTKQQVSADKYVYLFPLCTIEAYPDADPLVSYFFQYVRGESYKRYFNDITDKLGQTDLIAYLDECANQSIFFDLGGVGVGDATAANQVIQISEAQTTNTLLTSLDGKDYATETTLNNVLTELQNQDNALTAEAATLRVIAQSLFEIKFLLQAIAE